MLKEFVEKIVAMKENKTYEIEGRQYSDNPLHRIEAPRYYPDRIEVKGIGSIVSLIQNEYEKFNAPIFVEVENYKTIEVYTTGDERFNRQNIYRAVSDVPEFKFGWKPYNEAMIAFRSQFIQGEGTEYILDLLSSISEDNSVTSEDNGLSQAVVVKSGIGMKKKESVKPIVSLTPYRTFLEIEQPAGEFLLRLDENGQIGLFEADGGMWKMKAKERIADKLSEELEDLIGTGTVVVMF